MLPTYYFGKLLLFGHSKSDAHPHGLVFRIANNLWFIKSFVISVAYMPSTCSITLRGKNFSKRGNFKAVWSILIQNKMLVMIQDNKITYYISKGFFTINHWRPFALFIFNSETLVFYLLLIISHIYIYIYIYIYIWCPPLKDSLK